MPHGYNGRILNVDLTLGKIEIEQPDETFYRIYVGGSALGLYYLLRDSPPGANPLGPDNVLVLALSVLTGAPISGQSRMTAVARSPLTGAVGDAQCGGFFPAELKFAGFDALVIRGQAPEPVYLWIHKGQAELRPAVHLWGRVTGEVQALIQDELGDPRIEVAQCGPAGERGVRFASIINMANRANGRTGLGAVMGSKNLKAIAVRGKTKPDLADQRGLIKLAKWGADHFEESDVYGLGLFGTAEVTGPQDEAGGLPTRNWSSGTFEGAEALNGPTMAKTILKERDTCYACTVRCKRVVEITEGPYKADPLYGGPEYETLATFGSYCGVDDLAAVTHANQLCNMFGMDTISCGATIAWAMDCFEAGLIDTKDTGGLELRFGDAETMVKLTKMIGERDGFGDVLGEGSLRAAEHLGKGMDRVVAVKGQEMPAHMPQVKRSLALIYAANPFGADHQSHEHDPSWAEYPERMAEIGLADPQPDDLLNPEKVKYAVTTQYLYAALDSYNLCQFVFGPAWQLYSTSQMVEAIRMITGWQVDIDEILEVGKRRLNLQRAFNAREGLGRADDRLPEKLYQPLSDGASDGIAIAPGEVEAALDEYYRLCGWDSERGWPTRETLEGLDLGWIADQLAL
jgi:aldehyde:ferredoxin oxidoreductase